MRAALPLLFVSLCLGLSLCAPPAQAAQPGVVADLSWYIPDTDKARSAKALRELGSRWVRLHVQWREAEPKPGVFDEWWMAEYERAIAAARGAGQKVLVMVSEAPDWARAPKGNAPADPELLAGFLERFAARFRGRVEAWEIWNEPNIARFWGPQPDPAAYAALLRSAHRALRRTDPKAKVVFGGLSGNDYRFFERAWAAGAKGHYDVLATHPYTYCGSSGPGRVRRSGGRITPDSFVGYRELRASMRARKDLKPIWFTEFGWNTSSARCSPGAGQWQGGVSEEEQARYLRRAFKLAERDRYVKVAIWYSLRNNWWQRDADDPEARYGLLRSDYSRKPAFYAFKAYARPKLKPARTATSLALAAKPAGKGRRVLLVTGRVKKADSGRVRIALQRRTRAGSWAASHALSARLDARGHYRVSVPGLRKGRYRVRARYLGTDLHKASASRWRTFRIAR